MTTKIGAGTGDIAANDRLDYDMGPQKGAAPYVNVRVDGSVDTNNKWRIPQNEINQLIPTYKDVVALRDGLEDALGRAKAAGQENLAGSIQSQIDKLENGLAKLKAASESPPPMSSFATASAHKDLKAMMSEISKSGVAEMAPPEPGVVMEMDAPVQEVYLAATGTETTSTKMNDTEKTDFAAHVATVDAKDFATEFGNDPKGTWDKITQLPKEDRQLAMMQLQSGIQENNQLFSTLTNFMKAMHDTEKAIVSNLRV
jgi:hypothetical protein